MLSSVIVAIEYIAARAPWFLLLVLISILVLDKYELIGPKKYPGIFEIPGYPIVGNVFQIQKNPSKVFNEWSKRYQKEIFQIRLGNKRMIVVNSFKDVSEIWKKTSVNSRPIQYTFHNQISSTKGFTVGTTPFSETYKKRKQVVAQVLNSKNISTLVSILDSEVEYTIRMILLQNQTLCYQPSTNPHYIHSDTSLFRNFQYFSLRTSIYITYGFRLDCYNHDRDLSDQIISCENKIVNFRSAISNFSDFFPFLKRITLKDPTSWARAQRDRYMETLYNRRSTEQSFEHNIIGDFYEREKFKKLDLAEMHSICLTMISAGLDNTPLNLDHLIGQLSVHPLGIQFQNSVVSELLLLYGSTINAWKQVAFETEGHFTVALIKETLRYFTVLPLSLPRQTTNTIVYKGIVIPKDTTLLMNAFAANHDETQFTNAMTFDPYRWLQDGRLKSDRLISHFAFGKGVRMCSGNILAFKEMYMLITRILLCFKIRRPRQQELRMNPDPFQNNLNPKATSFEPKPFKYQLVPRTLEGNDELFNYIFR